MTLPVIIKRTFLAAFLGMVGFVYANEDQPAQTPLFTVLTAPPVMMINMSNDHQLYFKAYDDYSDLTGNGQPDVTYNHGFVYTGYFDSGKCYVYQGGRFTPHSVSRDRYCSGQWSGNFLNWATMTRMDIVRQILYGGLRSTDTPHETVLERAFIPPDAHSFAKYYSGSDLAQLTPYSSSSSSNPRERGITICNTTSLSGYSQYSDSAPLMRVARGNFSLWASSGRIQCDWSGNGEVGDNHNIPSQSGIYAYRYPPQDRRNVSRGSFDRRLGEFNVRVQVCLQSELNLRSGDQCQAYIYAEDGEENISYKPIGLLQEYGDNQSMLFGMFTGSYALSRRGGVLRANSGAFGREVNAWGGFVRNNNESIVNVLDRFRIYGYTRGSYNENNSRSDRCTFETDQDGRCANHGNPQAEILFESLRYIFGRSAPTPSFNANDSGYIVARGPYSRLDSVTWHSPSERAPVCSPMNILQFNASVVSYDGDNLGVDSGFISADAIRSSTNAIGASEGFVGRDVFAGRIGGNDDGLCTAKRLTDLSSLRGLCPQAPTQEGTYNLAGLARLARQGLTDHHGQARSVRIFGVDMQPSLPAITVPYGDRQEVVILPVFRNMTINPNGTRFRSGTLNDFRIVEQNHSGPIKTGTFFVAWDDSEHGNDHDVDVYGNISYTLDTNEGTLVVRSQGFQTSAWHSLRVGFSVSGTVEDGVFWLEQKRPHDGSNNYPMLPIEYGLDSRPLELGVSSGVLPRSPLFYAAKWGGYAYLNSAGQPVGYENAYFSVTNPAELRSSLAQVFEQAALGRGTAVNLASDGLGTFSDRFIFQTRFYSENWTGDLLAYRLRAGGDFSSTPVWRASQQLPNPDQRNLVTGVRAGQGWQGLNFDTNLAPSLFGLEQVNHLVNYVRGRTEHEERNGGILRNREHLDLTGRTNLLGDFVNSRPVFVSSQANFGHSESSGLTGPERTSYRVFRSAQRQNPSVVYVGSNAGMLHAFDAQTGRELFAYLPSAVLPHLRHLTDPQYTTQHRYFVDGQIRVMDVYDNNRWRRILIGSLGAGDRGLFALDVSNPQNFSPNDLLWELYPEDLDGLGHILGDLTIARLDSGHWALITGNGYSSGQSASLLMINALTGEEIQRLTPAVTEASLSNGLSAPFVADLNRNGIADVIYAGDLHGHVWRFDLRAQTVNRAVTALYRPEVARAQPITMRPEVSRHPFGGYAVHVATGRYFTSQDASVDIPSQRYMTLRDDPEQNLTGALIEQRMERIEVNGMNARRLTRHPMTADAKGCYFELPEQGERVVAPLNVSSQLLMTSLIPEADSCSVGARSLLYSFDPYTCGRADYSVFSESQVGRPDGDASTDESEVAISGIESVLGMSTGMLVQGPQVIWAGLQAGADATNIDPSGRLQDILRADEPGFRIWQRCYGRDDEC